MVKLKELTPRSTSRDRGRSVFELLQPLISDLGDVHLEMPVDGLVTSSFLDELVRLLAEGDQLQYVTFIPTAEVEQKLALISGTRDVDIFISDEHGRRLVPQNFFDVTADEVTEKPRDFGAEQDDR